MYCIFGTCKFLDLQSKIQTSVPSNIVELYSAMAVLIKESEERMTALCIVEFVIIREEMTALHKVGDTPVVVIAEQHIHPSSNIGSGAGARAGANILTF